MPFLALLMAAWFIALALFVRQIWKDRAKHWLQIVSLTLTIPLCLAIVYIYSPYIDVTAIDRFCDSALSYLK